jgi:hypothetical protein
MNHNHNHNHVNHNTNKPIDILTIIHLLIWIIIGYFFPNYYLIALLLGILWELFEYMLVRVNILYVLTKNYWFVPEKYWNEEIYNKFIDIIINMIGYYIGSQLLHKL